MYSQTGSVDIKDGYILAPESEQEQIQKNNPGVNVIGYNGTIAQDYGNALIKILGYRYMEGGYQDWCFYGHERDSEAFREILSSKNKFFGVENMHELSKKAHTETISNCSVAAYEYIFAHYKELFTNHTDMFNMEMTYNAKGWIYEYEQYEYVLSKLNEIGIHTASSLLNSLKKILETEDITKLTIEDIDPDIKKQSCKSEYAMQKFLTNAIQQIESDRSGNSRKIRLAALFFERGMLTAIAKEKGEIEFDGNYYETNIPQHEVQKIAIQRLSDGIYTIEEFRRIAEQYEMGEQRIEYIIAVKRYDDGEITSEEMKKISDTYLDEVAKSESPRPTFEIEGTDGNVFDSPKMDGVPPVSNETEPERIVIGSQDFSELASSDLDEAVSTIKRATREFAKDGQQEQTTDKEDKGEI